MTQQDAPVAVVTGATSGIGRAYADALVARGYSIIAVGRNEQRLAQLVHEHPGTRTVAADLSTDAGIDAVAALLADEPVSMLVNNAGVAHYMPLADLPDEMARELVHVKTVAPSLLTRAALPGMLARGDGVVINVAGMLAFAGSAPSSLQPRRALYAGGLSFEVVMSQTLAAELEGTGVRVQVVCPGIVATEFHTRQGMDVSAVPRMSPADVVTASLKGLELGETVVAPGVEDASMLTDAFAAQLRAFAGQGTELASRYRP